MSESLLARTANLNGTVSVANGSGPLSQVNGASTLVNADGGYRWDDHDTDDITLEMITDVGEDTGDEEVRRAQLSCFGILYAFWMRSLFPVLLFFGRVSMREALSTKSCSFLYSTTSNISVRSRYPI